MPQGFELVGLEHGVEPNVFVGVFAGAVYVLFDNEIGIIHVFYLVSSFSGWMRALISVIMACLICAILTEP